MSDDMVKKDVILAFLGKRSPSLIKIRKSLSKLIIDFREIKIPITTNDVTEAIINDEEAIRELEEKYNCRITVDGTYISIIPRKALEFKVLVSDDDETLRDLYEWFRECGVEMIKGKFLI